MRGQRKQNAKQTSSSNGAKAVCRDWPALQLGSVFGCGRDCVFCSEAGLMRWSAGINWGGWLLLAWLDGRGVVSFCVDVCHFDVV